MRILLRRPRWKSAREMFVSAPVITFKALLRNLMYRFICRLNASKNEIIVGFSNIGVSTSVKAVETLVLLYFVTLYVCDRCYGLYMLSIVFFKSGPWVWNKVWLIDIHYYINYIKYVFEGLTPCCQLWLKACALFMLKLPFLKPRLFPPRPLNFCGNRMFYDFWFKIW